MTYSRPVRRKGDGVILFARSFVVLLLCGCANTSYDLRSMRALPDYPEAARARTGVFVDCGANCWSIR